MGGGIHALGLYASSYIEEAARHPDFIGECVFSFFADKGLTFMAIPVEFASRLREIASASG